MSNNNNDSSLSSFLMGALIGAAIGVLFAPQEGSRTRELLKVRGEEAMDDLKDNLEKNALKARLVAEDAAGKVEKEAHEVRDRVEEGAEDVKKKVRRAVKKRNK